LIPFGKLFRTLLGIAFSLQVIIITYNHFTGYVEVNTPDHFIFRLLWGTLLSLIGAFLLAYPDLFIIRYLNRAFPWNKRLVGRILLQLNLAIILAVVVSICITVVSHLFSTYNEGIGPVLIQNGLIVTVCNILLMIVLEAWIFFRVSSESKKVTKNLEKEMSQIRFEVLKNQINPHFLFNSLNVLSGLIEKDTDKAQRFIDEFSHIYRYVLDTIEQSVVTVREELDFARSYMFLQQIRYGSNLEYNVDLPSRLLNGYLPPLSLQVVLENAIKHNLVSKDKPLQINIFNKNNRLIVRNNLQPKISAGRSTGIGQKNLVERYKIINLVMPDFRVETTHYQVSLPLIFHEDDECIDN
jgi:sensor histidine kinase YesM